MILSYVQVLGMSNLSFNTSTLVSTHRHFHNLIIISFCLLFTSSFIGELDSAHRPYLISVRPCVLLTGRGRRKSHTWYQHSPVTRCVPLARIQNFATDLARPPAHCQIPALHIHHEHSFHSGHCRHHQLEFQVCINISLSSPNGFPPKKRPLIGRPDRLANQCPVLFWRETT